MSRWQGILEYDSETHMQDRLFPSNLHFSEKVVIIIFIICHLKLKRRLFRAVIFLNEPRMQCFK